MPINPPLARKLRMGLVGAGFIGRVHVIAAALDHRAALVAGALSSDPAKAKALAADYDISPDRAYAAYEEMIEAESKRPDKVDFVSIATPNHTHYGIARAFAAAGFNVLCDKPLTLTLAEAEALAPVVRQAGVVFAVTHNYTGYPLVRQARDMILSGELGEVNAVRALYLQGSLRRQRTPEQQKRFLWKTDPERAGISGCFGDIGVHAYNLVRFVTRLTPESVSCHLRSFDGGRLDDYGSATFRWHGGALGTLTASRISHGRENDLRLEVDGNRGSLSWRQEEPNALWLRRNGEPARVYTRDPNAAHVTPAVRTSCRLPAGHPEGFFEAFANVYAAVFDDIVRRMAGQTWGDHPLYPTIDDGVEGMRFIDCCVTSSNEGGKWIAFV